MKKNIQILSFVFILQLALFAFFQTKKDPTAVYTQTEKLLTLDSSKVDKLEIFDSESKKLVITKVNGEWVLPESFNFPSSKNKAQKFIEKLSELKRSWPVGKTQIAAKQFLVTDEKFEKKIVLYENNNVSQTVYIGSSPSFKKVHSRVNDEDHTYSIDFNTYDLSTAANDWLDKDYYKIEKESVDEIVFEKVHLQQKDKKFSLVGDSHLKLDTDKVTSIVSKAISPSFETVLAENTFAHGKKVLSYDISVSGKKITFNYFSEKGEKQKQISSDNDKSGEQSLVLKISEYPYFFSVNKTTLEELISMDVNALVSLEESKEKQPIVDHKKIAKSE